MDLIKAVGLILKKLPMMICVSHRRVQEAKASTAMCLIREPLQKGKDKYT
jgi:hypothetical protein